MSNPFESISPNVSDGVQPESTEKKEKLIEIILATMRKGSSYHTGEAIKYAVSNGVSKEDMIARRDQTLQILENFLKKSDFHSANSIISNSDFLGLTKEDIATRRELVIDGVKQSLIEGSFLDMVKFVENHDLFGVSIKDFVAMREEAIQGVRTGLTSGSVSSVINFCSRCSTIFGLSKEDLTKLKDLAISAVDRLLKEKSAYVLEDIVYLVENAYLFGADKEDFKDMKMRIINFMETLHKEGEIGGLLLDAAEQAEYFGVALSDLSESLQDTIDLYAQDRRH